MAGRVWTGPPWQSCWESGRGPCGWQVRFRVAWVLPRSGPHPCLSEPPQHVTRGPPTGLHSAGTSPELTEPETSGHNIQPQVLTGASPVSVNSAPLGRLPRMTRESEPHCLVGGGLLPSASAPPPPPAGQARGEGGSARKLPGPQTSFSGVGVVGRRSGWGEGGVLWRVWGLQEGRRAWGGLGLGPRPGRVSNQGVSP